MNDSLQITLEIEGLDSEKGHVTLDALLEELTLIRSSLAKMDRLVDQAGRPAVYYRVIDATHSSPLTVTLEPVKIITKKNIPTDKRVYDFHHRYFSELSALHDGRPPSTDIDNAMLQVFHDLAKRRGKNFKTMRIQNHEASVMIDADFEKNVTFYLKEAPAAMGTMAGRLDATNLHEEANTFWIYPSIGPNRVRCRFPASKKDEIRNLLGCVVQVEGRKFYRFNSPFPHRIEVTDFYEVKRLEEDHMMNLRGLLSGNGDTSGSVELVKQVRDDWQ